MRREGDEDVLMIGIEPRELFWKEHVGNDGRLVDGTECEWFELKEPAEFGLLIRGDEQRVLDAHAKLPCEIDAGLVGEGHASHQGCRFPLHTELMRTLMDVEECAHAVACAVQIVQALAPQSLTGQDIELGTTGTRGELA